jgi:uncharacterized protein YjiS (DUF1127 family)
MLAPHGSDAANPFERARGARHPAPMRYLLVLWRAWTAARTRAQLRQLSDRALRDIGLTRRDVDALFR